MTTGPLILLAGVLTLLLLAGVWVVRLHRQQVPALVVLPAGENHSTVGRYDYFLSDYLDAEKQQRDRIRTEEHARKVAQLREYEQLTNHQAQLAEEQRREEAAWEASQEAIAQWLGQQQQADTQLNPAPLPPPPAVDFADVNLSPAKRRQAIFKNITAATASPVAA